MLRLQTQTYMKKTVINKNNQQKNNVINKKSQQNVAFGAIEYTDQEEVENIEDAEDVQRLDHLPELNQNRSIEDRLTTIENLQDVANATILHLSGRLGILENRVMRGQTGQNVNQS